MACPSQCSVSYTNQYDGRISWVSSRRSSWACASNRSELQLNTQTSMDMDMNRDVSIRWDGMGWDGMERLEWGAQARVGGGALRCAARPSDPQATTLRLACLVVTVFSLTTVKGLCYR